MGSLQRLLGYFEQVVPVVNKRIFVRPNAVDDFESRIITVRVNHQHASAGGEARCQRGNHTACFELERHAGPIGLRRDHQIVVAGVLTRFGNNRIEQKAMILAIQHQHRGAHVKRIAGLGARSYLPPFRQHRLQCLDLLVELVRGRPRERYLLPVQHRGRFNRSRHQPR